MSEKKIKFAKRIITAKNSNFDTLSDRGYVCISAEGKPYIGNVVGAVIDGIQTDFGMFLHKTRLRDYVAVVKLYLDKVNKKGIDHYLEVFDKLCEENETDTICFLDGGAEGNFNYRYILADFFSKHLAILHLDRDGDEVGLDNEFWANQKRLWKKDICKQYGHDGLDDEFVYRSLEQGKWSFAKTMPKNPHYYYLRKDSDDWDLYRSLVRHIRYFGEFEVFAGVVYRVWRYKGYAYWTMPQQDQYYLSDDDCYLINKRVISNDSDNTRSSK